MFSKIITNIIVSLLTKLGEAISTIVLQYFENRKIERRVDEIFDSKKPGNARETAQDLNDLFTGK